MHGSFSFVKYSSRLKIERYKSVRNTTPVGWVITAVVAAAVAVYTFVKGIINFFKRLGQQRKYQILWKKQVAIKLK